MKLKHKLAVIRSIFMILCACALINCIPAFFAADKTLFVIEFTVFAALVLFSLFYIHFIRKRTNEFLSDIAKNLNATSENALDSFPLPSVVTDENGEILWYNLLFRENVLAGKDAFDCDIQTILEDFKPSFTSRISGFNTAKDGKQFTVFTASIARGDKTYYSYYFVDDTSKKETVAAYYASRPAVILIYVDNLEESFQDLKDSDKIRIIGEIENRLDQYINQTNGFLKKLDRDRFLAVVEHQHMEKMIANRFEILDNVRGISTGSRICVTISIGVGMNGKDFAEDEAFARQALDMALGRGGDQAAVKDDNGYEFYGGVSKGVEKRSKIKTRIIASSIAELIEAAENVIIMGHRAADLDCLASASIMAKYAKSVEKEVFVAIRKEENLADALYKKLYDNGYDKILIAPEDAMRLIREKTLLIITDTHNTISIESPPILNACKHVIVIDHHRKMVNYIEKAVIFYHEPFASSASEMVTELCQYMGSKNFLGALEAEALLAGIMLDTKNFAMKTGVRTFEAAAYLRRLGADTTQVKKMFSSTMDVYRLKTNLVSSAEVYKKCAISVYDEEAENIIVVSAQAADDLLDINGVEASFVLYRKSSNVCISARSLGDINVQLIMEQMGGGGHLTMAGTQIADADVIMVRQRLVSAIDHFFDAKNT